MASFAAIDVYDFDSVQQEAQYRGLIEELRCPKCQNQNLAGSDAPIAQDLKQKTYDLVKDGRSDGEIRAYMQERYGDFISYKPPVRPSTWILWFFPPLLLIILLVGWFWQSKRRQLVASGASGMTVDSTAEALSVAEKAELERLLSRVDNKDDHDITRLGDKK
ncbi:cytochrome c-type biogenesis protein [Psychrobacter piscatorii]|uniref:cytochrome c-type biogenesis protein n=1 Tax=Psychrobacter piscatorii TaxID=554343 RepID=UPI003735823E